MRYALCPYMNPHLARLGVNDLVLALHVTIITYRTAYIQKITEYQLSELIELARTEKTGVNSCGLLCRPIAIRLEEEEEFNNSNKQ